MKNAGEDMTESDKLNHLLLCLPESSTHITDIVDALSEKEKKVKYMKSKLLLNHKKK